MTTPAPTATTTTVEERWNPRFVAYARAHGRTPEAQLEVDRAASHAVVTRRSGWA